jgi:dihydroflavonol-4-reductase
LVFLYRNTSMILVTGASGFLGVRLVQQLSAQHLRIRAVYHSHPPDSLLATLPGVEWVQCDLLDIVQVEEIMAGITSVYHCAAIVSFDPADATKMLHFNTESTAALVNECLIQNVDKFIYVSSVAALGRNEQQPTSINEEQEWGESKYNSAYGLSKYLAEMEVWRGIGEGLNAAIVNPGIILGAGDWNRGPAQIMKLIARGFNYYTTGTNSWVDLEDVVSAMIVLMESDIAAERYILSAGNFSYQFILSTMAMALGKKPPSKKAGKFLSDIMWRASAIQSMLTGKKPVITRETAQTAQSNSQYDNSKFLNAFPNFAYTDINRTIEIMADRFNKELVK